MSFLFWLLNQSLNLFTGKGVGQRFPLVGRFFFFIYKHVSPGITLAEIQGVKLYVDPMSDISRGILIKGSYEKGTTKLFRDLVKEGMVVLDIGANIGYISLIAAQLVGEKGKVFAFEPAPDSFALLVKNIEVNGFSNIIPVQKAVSNKAGKGKLFLSSDPGSHSMYECNGKESIEVEVTSIDEFMENINRPVDMIKMDVEGSEMRALEGMLETIRRNPGLKIITEFDPNRLQESGFSPVGFLEKLMDCGFKLYGIHEKGMVEFGNIDSIMEACPSKGIKNLYCQRPDNKSR